MSAALLSVSARSPRGGGGGGRGGEVRLAERERKRERERGREESSLGRLLCAAAKKPI